MTRLANSKPQWSYLHPVLLGTQVQVTTPISVFLYKVPSYLNSESMLLPQWNLLSHLPRLLHMLKGPLLKYHFLNLIRLHTYCIKLLLFSLIQRGDCYAHPHPLYRQCTFIDNPFIKFFIMQLYFRWQWNNIAVTGRILKD